MCLKIDVTIHPDYKPHIAEEDLLVFKVLINKVYISPLFSIFYSPFREYKWVVGMEQPPVELKEIRIDPLKDDTGDRYIDEGYHAFEPRAFEQGTICRSAYGYLTEEDEVFHFMKIPKGTKYFLGTAGDIVAEKMVFMDTLCYSYKKMKGKLHVFNH